VRSTSPTPSLAPAGAAASRLIGVEGIPSSGKTRTAAWIRDCLRKRGISAEPSEDLRRDQPVFLRETDQTLIDLGLVEGALK